MTPPPPASAELAALDPAIDPPLIDGNPSFAAVTDQISRIPETTLKQTPKGWYLLFGIASSLMLVLFGLVGQLFWEGIGVWGLQNPVGWGWAIGSGSSSMSAAIVCADDSRGKASWPVAISYKI